SLETENSNLSKQVQEKDAQITCLRSELEELLAGSPAAREAKDYKAEITQIRLQLEGARKSFDEEVGQFQVQRNEIEEKARQAELELSRERAQLARDKAQIERHREELRQDAERAQREACIRERLAGVQKLKDELVDRKPGGNAAEHARREGGWVFLLRATEPS